MSERRENSVLFSLNELKHIEEDRVRREDDERRRREDEERRRREEEDRRRREDDQRRMADEAGRRARDEAERKAEEERGKLQIEMAAQSARADVERKAAYERARIEAEKAGRKFDEAAFIAGVGQQKGLSGAMKAIIGLGAVVAVGLAGVVVYLVTRPPEIKTIVEEKVKIKTVEVEKPVTVVAPTSTDTEDDDPSDDPKKPRKPRTVKHDDDTKTAAPKTKTKISKDPLEGLEL